MQNKLPETNSTEAKSDWLKNKPFVSNILQQFHLLFAKGGAVCNRQDVPGNCMGSYRWLVKAQGEPCKETKLRSLA